MQLAIPGAPDGRAGGQGPSDVPGENVLNKSFNCDLFWIVVIVVKQHGRKKPSKHGHRKKEEKMNYIILKIFFVCHCKSGMCIRRSEGWTLGRKSEEE